MICQDNDAFYCKKYITSDVAIPEKDYNNSSRENIGNNIKDKNKINYNFILFTIGIIVVIALIVLIIFLIIKNKRDKEFMEIGGGLK